MTIRFKVVEPQSKDEFDAYYQLRWEVLRKPWNQPKGSERDATDSIAIHRMILDKDNNPIGVGMLILNSPEVAQIRFMGIKSEFQGMNIGHIIMENLESIARQNKSSKIILHSRENAVKFYEKNGFIVIEKSYLLFDKIQHYLMEKII
ncbi:MAG: GNAT family N-acetyltransferase [Candidatus Marinimicrobia bacterium]|jgi:predicted GNAT family N-acyltransferase|nr:GNAT family N-acetyltransferase [Candidatus Neomarinimicrobiota bacterium]MBT5955399.1 GNAT family N-acetyltransferase [Candidatus Neomarinimicrobiota bacterium]MBT7377594.1 GNAT family N-acetyltransferase [Candidatus Neomarinimicrobiota bacterium]|tara:strand:+ start:3805 stop:4248 length:444 start_codon:yes stop_codon:yes gene_type:complete